MYRLGPVPVCDISQVVRTGTYYITVQVGTGRYVPVRTDMYQVYRIPGQMWPAAAAAAPRPPRDNSFKSFAGISRTALQCTKSGTLRKLTFHPLNQNDPSLTSLQQHGHSGPFKLGHFTSGFVSNGQCFKCKLIVI